MLNKKMMLVLGATVALFGILNCSAIEYALAAVDSSESAQSHADSGDSCLTCHVSHHVALQSDGTSLTVSDHGTRFIPSVISLTTHSFIRLIFHPPVIS